LNAPDNAVMPKKDPTAGPTPMDIIFADAGLSPRNTEVTDKRILRATMPAHRLAKYAAKFESHEAGEKLWFALSRRWFMGKDTELDPIRLDDRALLLECSEFAGLNMESVEKVLDGEIITIEEIEEQARKVKTSGINWIPQVVFEVKGLAEGSWPEDPSLPESPYRVIRAGSGSKASFKAVLQQLHIDVVSGPDTTSQQLAKVGYNPFYPGMNMSTEKYSGNPNDYATAFESGMQHFPSWPAEAKQVVETVYEAQGETKDMAAIVSLLVEDSFGAFGTRGFSPEAKAEISERLIRAHAIPGLLRQILVLGWGS